MVAEAPVSAAVSALGGALLYPLVGLNPAPGKFANYLLTICLEGLASGASSSVQAACHQCHQFNQCNQCNQCHQCHQCHQCKLLAICLRGLTSSAQGLPIRAVAPPPKLLP